MIAPPLADAWSRHRLSRRVALLVGVGVSLAMLAVAWVENEAVGSLSAALEGERADLAASLAAGLERSLQADLSSLAALSTAPGLDLGDSDHEAERTAVHAAWLRTRHWSRAFVLDREGALVCAEPPEEGPTPPTALLPAESAAGRPVVSDRHGRYVFLLVPAFDYRGRLAGYAGAALDPARVFEPLLGDRAKGRAGRVVLVDGAGARLAPAAGADLASGGALEVAVAPTRWRLRVGGAAADQAAAGRYQGRLLFIAPAVLAVALAFGWGAARSVTHPLAVLAESARRIAGGDTARPVPYVGEDEVGRLGRSLEAMRAALDRSLEDVRQANRELESRVSERTAELQALYEEQHRRERTLSRLLEKLISAQEDERRRVARELHDETCQMLAALHMEVDAALQAPEREARRALLEGVKALASRALEGVHELIFDLRPSVLDDLGLLAALRWLAQRHLGRRGVAVRCEFEELGGELAPEVQTAVFRAAQEALVNVARHADADSVLIQVGERAGALEVEIEDDGKGFDPGSVTPTSPDGRGLGLLGLRERIELLGGSASVDSAPGCGTRVSLRVPLSPQGPS